jgi:hypothetical protein
MMIRLKFTGFILLIILLLFTVGCSTYKARSEGVTKTGYEETRLEDGRYELTYYGASNDTHERLEKLWHKRATELCDGGRYEASTTKDNWVFDAYTVLPPLIFKNKAAAPSVVGMLTCNRRQSVNQAR